MYPSQVAVAVLRLGTLLALSLTLFVASYARLTKQWPPLGVVLYSAYLAGVAALLLFSFSGLLQLIERNSARGRAASSLCALGLLSPFMHSISANVAAGDGLRSRGIAEWLTTSIGMVTLSTTLIIVWTYRFWARRRVLDVLFALIAIAGLLLGDALLSRAQNQLGALLELFALFLASQLLMNLLGDDARHPLRVGLTLALPPTALVLVGLCTPDLFASGRRRTWVAESPAAFVDAQLHGHARAQIAPNIDHSRCRSLTTPRPAPPLALAPEQRRNVVLISIDTLRADYVEKKIDGQPLMPALVRFTREAHYAPRAQAAFPATMLSLTSAFSGFMPSDLLLAPEPIANIFTLTREHMDRVETILPDGNYFTRADVQAFLLSGSHAELMGNAQQETHYTIARLRDLRAENKRHLLWVHYYEPHGPYRARPPYEFGDSELGRYQSEIATVDSSLNDLFSVLRDEGWYDDSLIMVLADHGESFGEHDHHHHHYLVYPWLVNVPLVWHIPGITPTRVNAPVHLMDVAATVLHFLDLPSPGGMRGVSLLARQPPSTRALFSEEISLSGHKMLQYRLDPPHDEAELSERLLRIENAPGYAGKLAVRKGDLYLVQQRASRADELYLWRQDLRAEHDLADVQRWQAAALEREAERFRRDVLERAACALR